MTAQELRGIVTKDLDENKRSYRICDFKKDSGECAIDTDVMSESEVFHSYEIRLLFRKYDMRSIYYFPVKVPESMRGAVTEYLMRINWCTRYGKFILDFEDGEIRYEATFSAAEIKEDVGVVLSGVINMMQSTADRYASGLLSVMGGGKMPEEAFKEACKPKNPPPSAEPPPEEPPAPLEGSPAGADECPVEYVPDPDLDDSPKPKSAPEKKRGKKVKKASARYSLKGLNLTTPVPLKDIVAAVRKFRSGTGRADVDAPRLNILLSGAPGSGKTAFVKYLAREVGAPLKVLKASDLVGRYTGETEKAIAKAFKEAKENGEILFLDEIDSFLQNRAGASHSWEVMQVNELLQQMEEFEGVMVGATNFVENLDKAVLRRFTYKLKLDYLTDEGKDIFFRRYFKTRLTASEQARLKAISNLTPGDFRTVREELFYLVGKQTNSARLSALEAESAAKGKTSSKIGF